MSGRTHLGARTWPTVEPALLLLPLGSCEQHGPHLPLDTDVRIAEAIADRAASRLSGAVVAPALPYGASGEHAAFTGTLSIGTDALTAVLVELGRSAIPPHLGIAFVSGHGGNDDAVRAAVDQLSTEGRAATGWSPRVADGDAHAGHTETSLMLAIAPHLVRTDRMAPGDTRPLMDVWPIIRSEGLAAVSPNGVLGDPTGADAATGRRLLDQLADDVVATIG